VVLVTVLAAATPIGLLLYSAVGTDLLAPRNLSASIPALCLLLGWLIARLPGRLELAGGALFAAGLLLGLVIGLGASKQRPDLRAAAALIDARAGARDVYSESLLSLSEAPELTAALRINFERPHARAAPLAFRREGGRLRAVADRSVWLLAAGGRRVFVVAPELPGVHAIPVPPADLTSRVRREETRRFPGIYPIDVAVYGPR
jgi:hypothetical protein